MEAEEIAHHQVAQTVDQEAKLLHGVQPSLSKCVPTSLPHAAAMNKMIGRGFLKRVKKVIQR